MNYKNMLAVVAAVSDTKIVVRVAPKKDFSSCAEKGCHLCAAPTKSLEITIPRARCEMCAVGESVVVSIPFINEAIVAAIVFLTPLCTAGISAMVLNYFGKSLESGFSVGIILAVFLLSFVFPLAFERLLRMRYPVTITPHGGSC